MKFKSLLAAAALITTSFVQAHGVSWNLNQEDSSLYFVSIKKDSIGELHHFKSIKGDINSHGNVFVQIDLSSVETNIPIRNERMQKMLFNTAVAKNANIELKTDIKKLKALKAGEQFREKVKADLTLVGVNKEITAKILVTKLTGNKFSVTTLQPILINAKDFNLDSGIEALQKIAGLPSIARSVPVTFTLVFEG